MQYICNNQLVTSRQDLIIVTLFIYSYYNCTRKQLNTRHPMIIIIELPLHTSLLFSPFYSATEPANKPDTNPTFSPVIPATTRIM